MHGSHPLFRAIYDSCYDDLWRYCLRRCMSNEHAEEVLSETFTIAWRRLDDVPAPPASRAYVFGIARNVLRNQRRSIAGQQRLTDRLRHESLAGSNAPDSAALNLEASEVLIALRGMNDDDQELLRLVAWEALPHAEIAEVLGCSVNAVGIRLHRARQRLTERLDAASIPLQPCTTERNPS